ncbi:hypothetical protein EJ04DRAFT_257146 [Polyplosphaeria fusca]|uniref:Uncharacterized protein n=1 Tax=Polyplosphaeria fusca TaxID=682080 RepID=A0A9P4QZI1_9PLEO|nr:hypothetical protein EJ04DRAFT_257146 [Polyplosphaeria fusca]
MPSSTSPAYLQQRELDANIPAEQIGQEMNASQEYWASVHPVRPYVDPWGRHPDLEQRRADTERRRATVEERRAAAVEKRAAKKAAAEEKRAAKKAAVAAATEQQQSKKRGRSRKATPTAAVPGPAPTQGPGQQPPEKRQRTAATAAMVPGPAPTPLPERDLSLLPPPGFAPAQQWRPEGQANWAPAPAPAPVPAPVQTGNVMVAAIGTGHVVPPSPAGRRRPTTAGYPPCPPTSPCRS